MLLTSGSLERCELHCSLAANSCTVTPFPKSQILTLAAAVLPDGTAQASTKILEAMHVRSGAFPVTAVTALVDSPGSNCCVWIRLATVCGKAVLSPTIGCCSPPDPVCTACTLLRQATISTLVSHPFVRRLGDGNYWHLPESEAVLRKPSRGNFGPARPPVALALCLLCSRRDTTYHEHSEAPRAPPLS